MRISQALIAISCVPLVLVGLSACQPKPTPAGIIPGGGAACQGTIAFYVPQGSACYNTYGPVATITGTGPTFNACFYSQGQLRNALFQTCGTLTEKYNHGCVCKNGNND